MPEGEVAARAGVPDDEELADRNGEFRIVKEPVAVVIEPAEGPFGLVGAGTVRRRQPQVLPGVEHSVAVLVGHLDQGLRRGADGGVETGAVLDAAAQAGQEFVPGDLASPARTLRLA